VGQLGGETRAVAVQGAYAYIGVGPRLVVVDISNPAHPAVVGQTTVLTARPFFVEQVQVAGAYVYMVGAGCDSYDLCHGYNGMWVIDVSDPTAPREVSSYVTPGPAHAVYLAGSYAYVGWGKCRSLGSGWWECDGGLQVVNVADPTVPEEVGIYRASGEVNGVSIAGAYAYVTARNFHNSKLLVVDVSDPTRPVTAGVNSDWHNYIGGIYVSGTHAYVLDGSLDVIDVSDPGRPVTVGGYAPPGFARDVFVAGRYAYLAAEDAGLRVVDVSDSHMPLEVGFYDSPGVAEDAYVAGPYAYLADGSGGLLILRFTPTASASISPAGGSLVSPRDHTTYTFAAGTFTDTVILNHVTLSPGSSPSTDNLLGIGHSFVVTAVYSSTGQPARPTRPYTVTVQYTDAEKGPVVASTLGLFHWDGTCWIDGQWEREATSVVDPVHNTVTATPNDFGLWAVLGETRRMFLPVVLRKSVCQKPGF
jgi:hypothetical protein